MNDTALQFTLRELQRMARSSLLWTSLAGIALVLGLIGPFGTYDTLPLAARVAYWAVTATSTYFIALAVVQFAEHALFDAHPSPLVYAGLGALAGPPIGLFVWLINLGVLGMSDTRIGLAALMAYCTPIAAIASGIIASFGHHGATLRPAAAQERPPLIDRLPLAARGRLFYLSMQDHYVEVITDKGSHLLLMRLADAIAETKGVEGLQIHRSHWVARNAVKASARRDGRQVLVMEDGVELPVSRGKMEAVRDAGLL